MDRQGRAGSPRRAKARGAQAELPVRRRRPRWLRRAPAVASVALATAVAATLIYVAMAGGLAQGIATADGVYAALLTARATVVMAVATVLLSLFSVLAVQVQQATTRDVQRTQIIIDFHYRFQDEPFRAKRARVAATILRYGLHSRDIPHGHDLGDIVNHFELVAFLVRRENVDRETAWFMFSHWVLHYCTALDQHIAKQRAKNPTVWQELDALYRDLLRLEREHGGTEAPPPDKELQTFLAEEVQLRRGLANRILDRLPRLLARVARAAHATA